MRRKIWGVSASTLCLGMAACGSLGLDKSCTTDNQCPLGTVTYQCISGAVIESRTDYTVLPFSKGCSPSVIERNTGIRCGDRQDPVPGHPTQPKPEIWPKGVSPALGNSLLEFKPVFRLLPFPAAGADDPAGVPQGCDMAVDANVFITQSEDQTVLRYHTCSGKIAARIPVGTPLQADVTPDGKLAVITNYGSVTTPSIVIVDTATNGIVSTVEPGGYGRPCGVAVTPDGARAYVTSFTPAQRVVWAIDLASRRIVATIPLPDLTPHSAFITPDGSQVYITDPYHGVISVIDTLTNTVAAELGSSPQGLRWPWAVAFNPTGTLAYIADGYRFGPPGVNNNVPGTVIVLNATTYDVVKTYSVGDQPTDIRFSPAGRWLFVTNYRSNSISVIDTVTDKVDRIKTSGKPMGLAFVR